MLILTGRTRKQVRIGKTQTLLIEGFIYKQINEVNMSVLSMFAILFETDAKEAAKDVEKLESELGNTEEAANKSATAFSNSEASIKELVKGMKNLGFSNAEAAESIEKLGHDYNTALDEVQNYNDSIKEQDNNNKKSTLSFGAVTRSILSVAAAYITVGSLATSAMAQAKNIDELGKYSAALDLNKEDVNAWGNVVVNAGGTAEGFRNTLSSLQNRLIDVKFAGSAELTENLGRIGIKATDELGNAKDEFELLLEVAKAFEGMSKKESLYWGRKLGFDDNTIRVLQQTRGEVGKLVAEQKRLAGPITEETTKAVDVLFTQWNDTLTAAASLWTKTFNDILPVLSKTLEDFKETAITARESPGLFGGVGIFERESPELFKGLPFGWVGAITAISNGLQELALITDEKNKEFAGKFPGISEKVIDNKSPSWLDWFSKDKEKEQETILVSDNKPLETIPVSDNKSSGWFDWFSSDKKAIDDTEKEQETMPASDNKPLDKEPSAWRDWGSDDTEKGQETILASDNSSYQNEMLDLKDTIKNTMKAKETIDTYAATPLNHGGYNDTRNMTQTNHIEIKNEVKIDANRMSAKEAKREFDKNMSNEIQAAIVQLKDGIEG